MAAKPFTRPSEPQSAPPSPTGFNGSNEGWPVWELRNDPKWLLLSNS